METIITITNGAYSNKVINGQFIQVKGFRTYSDSERKPGGYAKDGFDGFVKVCTPENPKPFNVHVTSNGFSCNTVANATQQVGAVVKKEEVDLDALNTRIAKRFNVLGMMSGAVIGGDVRGLIVSGAPGIGKTYQFENDLVEAHERGDIQNFKHIKGKLTPLSLYETLFNHSQEGDVVLLDDSDSVFEDETSMNILKAATDSGDRRFISYGSTCKYLEDNDIPKFFEFKGTIVFITNLDFAGMIERGTRLAPHFSALISRSHYLTLGVYSNLEIMVRVQQIANQTNLLAARGVDDKTTSEMVDWMWENVNELREVSIRTLLKLADYANMSDWKEMAEVMLLK